MQGPETRRQVSLRTWNTAVVTGVQRAMDLVCSEAGGTRCETAQGRPACEEELRLDSITPTAPAVPVVTTAFQMKKTRLREVCSSIQETVMERDYPSGAMLGAGEPAASRERRASRSVLSDSLQPHGPYSPWNSPG